MTYPKQSQTVHVEMLNDELCLYDWQRKEVHALNPTAATVWQLCNGKTSPAQMATQLRANLETGLDAPQAEALVWTSLEQLRKANLLDGEVAKPAGRPVLTRRQMLKVLGGAAAGAALLPVVSSIVAPGPVEAQSPVAPGSQTFSFTGTEQTFTVPAGVTSVTIDASGAEGARAIDGFGNPTGAGGQGGFVRATIPMTPGETLFINVGGAGVVGGAGGFNGGGAGSGGASPRASGGGGGASDVRQGSNALTDRVVVIGGGGGSGGGEGTTDAGAGGAGGNTNGAAGGNGSGPAGSASGGGGGTPAAGGAGGTGNPGADGANGVLGVGGGGGAVGAPYGGGGGGGYYGGGGGEASAPPGPSSGGGGGGGSSFTAAGATGVAHTQGSRTGDGEVVISW